MKNGVQLLEPRLKGRAGKAQTVCPASATRGWIVAVGFAAWASSLWLARTLKLADAVEATVLCVGALALVNFGLDVVVLKVHRQPFSGLDWSSPSPSWRRTAIKLWGMVASLGFIALLYWLFPEYHGDFYADYQALLRRYLPWWLLLSVPYFYIVDARQKDPYDGYYAAGLAAALQFRKVDLGTLWQHCLSWLVKGFFLALMFTYYVHDTRKFISYDFSRLRSFQAFYDFLYYFIFLADTGVACAGYLLTLRLFGTHVRRTEPTVLGWAVALVCYQPFWSWFSGSYLNYSKDFAWGAWLDNHPGLYALWGSMILALLLCYVWATIIFGCRFSNLTHRGILTNGPYAWTKHPAYLSKNLAYWLIYIPFIVSESAWDSVRRCLLLGLLNFIYYLRAKTEEANLSTAPEYVRYAAWINAHGLFRRMSRCFNRF